MAINSSDIFQLAASQLDASACEAEYRNLMGRAYYSVYHKAIEFHDALPSPGNVPYKTGSHATLRLKLQNPTVDNETADKSRVLGRMILSLHKRRCEADYDLHKSFEKQSAMQMLEEAKIFFDLASE